MPACVLLYAMRRTDSSNTKRYIQGYKAKTHHGGRMNRNQNQNENPTTSTSSANGSGNSGWLKNLFVRQTTEPGYSLNGLDDMDGDEDGGDPGDDDYFSTDGSDDEYDIDGNTVTDPNMLDHVASPLLRNANGDGGMMEGNLTNTEHLDFYQGAPNNNGLYRYN